MADKVIPWRLKLQELFFFFLKEVVPVSPENWGEGRTSALVFMEPRPAQTKSSPKREALDGELRVRTTISVTTKHTGTNHYTENEIHFRALFDNKGKDWGLDMQAFVFKLC